jgi:hypothetical protein
MYNQLLCHLIGDYVLQSGWMANNKTKRWFPAIVHALVYFVPFLLFIQPSLTASIIMIGSHAIIDRFRLARHVAYIKEYLAPKKEWKNWSECRDTGYPSSCPPFLSTWLMIITDNTLHLVINALCIALL